MTVITRNVERRDLPLVSIPICFPAMVPMFASRLDAFDGLARVVMYDDLESDETVLAERMEDATVVISTGIHFSHDLLERVSRTVRCVTFGGTGVASFVDLAQASRLGISVCNAVHYGDNAVAEHAIALMFELTHRVGTLNARMRPTAWPISDIEELTHRTLGLVGFGGIGRRVAQLARGLGMPVTVWSRHPDRAALAELGASAAPSMDDVFARADVVSLHLALNEATEGMIGDRQLDLLRPGSMLINTARAELIAPGALERRLSRGDVTAGVDVFAPEPLPPDAPLRSLDNVVMTPHVAWKSPEAFEGIVEQNVRAAVAFLHGESYNVVV
ncbi:NAD(P)-dependent oxidoreductase [Bifidobacterium simiarum]|nr:NAD(P)-dependent oxidoreductase [Bifidobacterium simiarum]